MMIGYRGVFILPSMESQPGLEIPDRLPEILEIIF